MSISTNFEGTMNDVHQRLKQMMGDQLICSIFEAITKTGLGNTYTNIFPVYGGLPIPIDFNGFTKLGLCLYWNKNGGAARHDFRIVDWNNGNPNSGAVLLDTTTLLPSGLVSEPLVNETFDYPLTNGWLTFRGKIILQVKSATSNNPIFNGVVAYLIR